MKDAPTILRRSEVIGSDNMLIVPCQPGGISAEGCCQVRRADGSLQIDIHYINGVPDGPYRDYWSNGELASEGHFTNGVPDGLWHHTRLDGTTETIRFANGREVREQSSNKQASG